MIWTVLSAAWAAPEAAATPSLTWEIVDRPFAGGVRQTQRPFLDGRPVFGRGAADPPPVQLGPRGSWRSTATPDASLARVRAAIGSASAPAPWPDRVGEGWWVEGDDWVPVWVVDLATAAPFATWRVWVDAETGALLDRRQTSRSAEPKHETTTETETETEATTEAVTDRYSAFYYRIEHPGLPNFFLRPDLVDLEGLPPFDWDRYPDTSVVLSGEHVTARSCTDLAIDEGGMFACTAPYHLVDEPLPSLVFIEDEGSLRDPQAEVQAYHAVDQSARWFSDRFGFALSGGPIDAFVNFRYPNAFWGDLDGDGAADLSFGQSNVIADLGGVIAIYETERDLAYDADVVRHEHAHAVVHDLVPDLAPFAAGRHGVDFAPGSADEAAADLFAAIQAGDPYIGEWGGALFAKPYLRDLSERRTCPADLVGESHNDGRVLSSLGWALVEDPAVGPDAVAELLYGAIPLWGPAPRWGDLARSLQQTADDLRATGAIDDRARARIDEEIAASGMADCAPYVDLPLGQQTTRIALTGPPGVPIGVAPQLAVDVPSDEDCLQFEVIETLATPGVGWELHVSARGPIDHEEVDFAGLSFAAPATADVVLSSETSAVRRLPAPPGARVYVTVAGRAGEDALPTAYDVVQVRVDRCDEEPPYPTKRACTTGPAPGSLAPWALALPILLLALRSRRAGRAPRALSRG